MGVGADYTYNSTDTVSPQTEAKIQVWEKKYGNSIARDLFGWSGSAAGSVETSLDQLDKVTRERLRGLFAQEIAIAGGYGTNGSGSVDGGNTDISNSTIGSGIAGSIRGATEDINRSVNSTINNINEAFRPVSREIGSTLGNISNFAQDPFGTIALIPGSLKNVIERNNPEFAARLEATYKKYNIEGLTNLPSQVLGSVGQVLTTADAIISLPFIIISDLYNGLLEILEAIADAIDAIIANLIKQFLKNFLDGLILEIIQVLNELSDLAGIFAGITGAFTGVNDIVGYALNIQTWTSSLASFLSNPLDLLFAYAPPQVSEALYVLRNPQQLVNSLIPDEVNNFFGKLGGISGFGFNGNMGYGFVSFLEAARGGILQSILNNFAAQYPILTPLLGMLYGGSALTQNADTPPVVEPSDVNPDVKVTAKTQSIQPQTVPQPVIPDNTQSEALVNASNTISPIANRTNSIAPVTAGTTRSGNTGTTVIKSIFDLDKNRQKTS
jgi:hypothetical protein